MLYKLIILLEISQGLKEKNNPILKEYQKSGINITNKLALFYN